MGVGWHVPLVGVEGRGGYKPSPQEQESKKQSPSEGEKSLSVFRKLGAACAGCTYTQTQLEAALSRCLAPRVLLWSGQKRALTVKERERLKRKKGQSSHATWKPETWMQLRQQYD